jgi:hypothetical protein
MQVIWQEAFRGIINPGAVVFQMLFAPGGEKQKIGIPSDFKHIIAAQQPGKVIVVFIEPFPKIAKINFKLLHQNDSKGYFLSNFFPRLIKGFSITRRLISEAPQVSKTTMMNRIQQSKTLCPVRWPSSNAMTV